MKARVLVRVDRDAALAAIQALDALSAAYRDDRPDEWRTTLKQACKNARRGLIDALGYVADSHGLKA